jgi:hypothetical protein
VNYAKFYSRSHDAVIQVYDEAGNVIATHEQAGEFKEWCVRLTLDFDLGRIRRSARTQSPGCDLMTEGREQRSKYGQGN